MSVDVATIAELSCRVVCPYRAPAPSWSESRTALASPLAFPSPLSLRPRGHHGQLAELAATASPLPPSPLTTHHVNHHLRLFLLYDRRTSAEAKTTGAA